MANIGVKFVKGGKVYSLESNDELNINDCVVVESERGVELAYVSALPSEVSDDEKLIYVRKATNEDIQKKEKLDKNIPNVVNIANKLIDKYKLEMKLVDVSYTLDGSKVIISYICEDRVDFRELVKDLAYELKLRIELKQIGVRDQAKTLGGIGLCGKECCCKQYLNDFDKVSVKMAKVQGLSLNPAKISGLCGRLMCCLAYENETYAEIVSKMPKMNSRVKTPDGEGVVVYNNILKQMVSVKIENNGDYKINEYQLGDIVFGDLNKEKMDTKKDQSENNKKDKEVNNLTKDVKVEKIKNVQRVEKTTEFPKDEVVTKVNLKEDSKPQHKNKKKFNNFKKKSNVKK